MILGDPHQDYSKKYLAEWNYCVGLIRMMRSAGKSKCYFMFFTVFGLPLNLLRYNKYELERTGCVIEINFYTEIYENHEYPTTRIETKWTFTFIIAITSTDERMA